MDYKKKSNLLCADCYNVHAVKEKEVKKVQELQNKKQKAFNIASRWEKEADRIMKIVCEHKAKEKITSEINKAKINSKRNGYHKKTITPKITEKRFGHNFPSVDITDKKVKHVISKEQSDENNDSEDDQSEYKKTLAKKTMAEE